MKVRSGTQLLVHSFLLSAISFAHASVNVNGPPHPHAQQPSATATPVSTLIYTSTTTYTSPKFPPSTCFDVQRPTSVVPGLLIPHQGYFFALSADHTVANNTGECVHRHVGVNTRDYANANSNTGSSVLNKYSDTGTLPLASDPETMAHMSTLTNICCYMGVTQKCSLTRDDQGSGDLLGLNGRAVGFTGAQTVHRDQIDRICNVLVPTPGPPVIVFSDRTLAEPEPIPTPFIAVSSGKQNITEMSTSISRGWDLTIVFPQVLARIGSAVIGICTFFFLESLLAYSIACDSPLRAIANIINDAH